MAGREQAIKHRVFGISEDESNYAGREEEMPYKTLAGFRRARRAQAESYKDNRKDWNSMQEIATNNLTDWKLSGRIGIEPNPNAKKDCAVSWKAINTKAHNDGIRSLVGNNSVIGKAISNIETEMLKHRQGTEYEDLYLIDSRTGKVVAKNISSQALLKVSKTKEMEDALSASDERSYILVHNHPYSSPPSVADLNSLFKNLKRQYGIIIGHNGIVYKYTAPNEEIGTTDLEFLIKHYRKLNYTQKTAEEKAYNSMINKYNFILEVFENEK